MTAGADKRIVLTSIWLHPWDLEGWEPAAFVDRLRSLGLDACQLALAYHATRLLLPTHRDRRVFESSRSGIYFPLQSASPAGAASTGLRLGGWTPDTPPEAALTLPFLEACQRAGFPARAWVVLCHQDGAGATDRRAGGAALMCVTNVYGDRYHHALCPSQPEVRAWAAALCGAAARLPGVDALDVEAASCLGVDHHSAHDKRGVALPASIAWLLSICVCPACRHALDPACADEIAARARAAVDAFFHTWPAPSALNVLASSAAAPGSVTIAEVLTVVLGDALLRRLLDVRQRAQIALLQAIRQHAGPTRVMLRLAASPFFAGGKSTLPLSTLGGLADDAVLTWLGADLTAMRAELAALPPPEARRVPIHGGFTLHAPDCRAPEDVETRLDLLRAARVDGAIAYCYGLATEAHLTWLREATHRRRTG